MPKLDHFKLQKSSYYALGPIMENKGMLTGTYSVIKDIFSSNNGDYGF